MNLVDQASFQGPFDGVVVGVGAGKVVVVLGARVVVVVLSATVVVVVALAVVVVVEIAKVVGGVALSEPVERLTHAWRCHRQCPQYSLVAADAVDPKMPKANSTTPVPKRTRAPRRPKMPLITTPLAENLMGL